ncbi:MAG: dihydrofolate reductase [Oscillospiraceae bacterium]|nr:dihydrofolate reductase [Oscillospiraceae bacterium]
MLSIIVAIGNNNVIGLYNKMPWYIPDDLKYFKEKTLGKTVIMGRKTLESIGGPLKDRKNIVISRNKSYSSESFEVLHDFSEVKKYIDDDNENFIIGGAEIYREFLHFCEFLYVTRVYKDFKGDKFFDHIDENEWRIVNASGVKDYMDLKYEFFVYERYS